MRNDDLMDYQQREEELATRQRDEINRKKDEADGAVPVVLDFFPELRERLVGKAYANLASFTLSLSRRIASNLYPIKVQLPFFDSVVFPIANCPDAETFKAVNGLTVEECLDLIKQGLVVPMLMDEPSQYLGLDYLDPLLEQRPPSYPIRIEQYDDCILSQLGLSHKAFSRLYTKIRKENKPLFDPANLSDEQKRNLAMLIKLTNPIMFENAAEYKPLWKMLLTNLSYSQANLSAFGYERLAEKIGLMPDPILKALASWAYFTLLYTLPRLSLGGQQCWSSNLLHFSDIVGIPHDRRRFVFPEDVGKVLIPELILGYYYIGTGIGEIVKIHRETEEFRRVLRELDQAVISQEAEKAMDKAGSLSKIWNTTSEHLQSMVVGGECPGWTIPSLVVGATVGVVGSIVDTLDQMPGMIAASLQLPPYHTRNLPVAEPTAETLAKSGRPSHVTIMLNSYLRPST